jgi:hypothetical protein
MCTSNAKIKSGKLTQRWNARTDRVRVQGIEGKEEGPKSLSLEVENVPCANILHQIKTSIAGLGWTST